MTKDAQEKLTTAQATQHDWYGTCRHCGKKLTGTPQELREHAKVCHVQKL